LERAIELDPEFALAHCGYADQLLFLASARLLPAHETMPLVRQESQKALDIDPSLPEAHAMLGNEAALYDYNWKEAGRRFDMAMAQDPIPPRVRQWYGWIYLLPMGRAKEAVNQQEEGLKGDPLNIVARASLAMSLIHVGKLADAQVEARKILELEENSSHALVVLALTYARQEKWVEAAETLRSFAERASSVTPQFIGTLAGALKIIGEVNRAEDLIKRLMPGEAYGAPFGLALYYLLCEEMDRAAEWWEKVIEQRHPLASIYGSIFFRSTSRWPALARLMNLPEDVR